MRSKTSEEAGPSKGMTLTACWSGDRSMEDRIDRMNVEIHPRTPDGSQDGLDPVFEQTYTSLATCFCSHFRRRDNSNRNRKIQRNHIIIRLHQFDSGTRSAAEPPLPTRLLKPALVRHGLKIGAKVLVAGCGHGELVAFVHDLGYQVDAIDDSLEQIDHARRRFPQCEFQYLRLDQSTFSFDQTFDLILVQDLKVYRDNLLDCRVRHATANLLSCLKPAGDLVFIQQKDTSKERSACHQPTCWKGHLAGFPGHLQLTNYAEPFFGNARWDWLFGARAHCSYSTITLQTPEGSFHRRFWHERAASAPGAEHVACCPIASSEARPLRRSA
jgi:SAM-dependent methyltransferase